MINLDDIIRQMTANAQAIRALMETISNKQAQWKPNPETWSLQQVMEHVYNEERIDFRQHLKEMLNDPPQAWGALQQEGYIPVKDCRQALESFLIERKASINWITALDSLNLEVVSQAPFGPAGDILVLCAADVLVSWVAHDFLHIRQMNELLYAWNEKQASPYSVQYAGGW